MKPYYKTNDCALYQCDNLDLMKSLPNNYIDLIYCDVLYNTGKKYKDFDDRLGTPEEAIEWYCPRLIEMKRILKETGSIYLQMDYRLIHYMKVKMDEIFGMKNFINEMIIRNKRGGNGKYFLKRHDTILFYSKSKNIVFNKIRGEKYQIANNAGWVKEISQYNGELPYPQEMIDKINSCPSRNCFVSVDGAYLSDVWFSNNVSYHSRKYDTQKPRKLLERIIKASSNENNIVADFFMGSGTTGEVALELGRKFIGCDIGDKACKISKERVINIIK